MRVILDICSELICKKKGTIYCLQMVRSLTGAEIRDRLQTAVLANASTRTALAASEARFLFFREARSKKNRLR